MKRDLEARTYLLTRSEADSLAWASCLRERGAIALVYPCLETRTLPAAAEQARDALQRASWIAFTSPRAVDALAELCPGLHEAEPQLACVGEATAERCKRRFSKPDFVSRGQTGEAFAQELRERCHSDDRILLPAARAGRRDFEEVFRAAELLRVSVYETIVVAGGEAPPAHDVVFFSSPSAVVGFGARAGRPLPGTLLVAIGPTTAAALEARSWGPVVVATSRDLDGMLRATREHWRSEAADEQQRRDEQQQRRKP